MKAFAAALQSNDEKQLLSIFGPAAKELISSGDPVRDKQRREMFISDYDRKNSITQEGAKMVLVVGEKDWPFPIPLGEKGRPVDFRYESGEGGDPEPQDRRKRVEHGADPARRSRCAARIRDEDRDNDGLLEYAEKFRSDPGKKNGLYWETKEGEEPSPLGELVADARAEGYTRAGTKQRPHALSRLLFQDAEEAGEDMPPAGHLITS